MKIIVGLGNPGEKYNNTRHNIGFEILDKLRATLDFPDFAFSSKFNADLSKDKEVLLVKPQTFMNRSGEAVQAILDFYKLTPEDIIVIHDDLDIEIGNYKISSDSSSAGHNGVQDIIDKLGTQNFKRLRIGVETAGGRANRIIPGEDFVLQNFTEEENEKIKNISDDVIIEIKKIIIST